MAWADTDEGAYGGYGEFGGGYEGSPAGGGWQDNALSLAMAAFDKDLDYDTLAAYLDSPYAKSNLNQYGFSKGHHPGLTVTGRYGAPTDANPGGYLAALQNELAHINQNVPTTPIPDSLFPSKVRDYGNFFGPHVQQTQQTFFDPREVGRQREDLNRAVLDADTARARSNYFNTEPDWTNWVAERLATTEPDWTGPSGSYNTGVTQNSDAGWAEGGGEPYIRPRRRLAYQNAYDQWDEQGGFGGGM